jgi:hypothetical protein
MRFQSVQRNYSTQSGEPRTREKKAREPKPREPTTVV